MLKRGGERGRRQIKKATACLKIVNRLYLQENLDVEVWHKDPDGDMRVTPREAFILF